MTKPNITIHDAATGETVEREMTDEEYADLIASGWTDEVPASDDADAPSTDAGTTPVADGDDTAA